MVFLLPVLLLVVTIRPLALAWSLPTRCEPETFSGPHSGLLPRVRMPFSVDSGKELMITDDGRLLVYDSNIEWKRFVRQEKNPSTLLRLV